MSGLSTRSLEPADRPSIETLLDMAIGRGFWDPARDLDDIVVVALEDGVIIGVASATVESDSAETACSPVGHVRLVAVAPAARHRGVATRLVSEVSTVCEARGARSLLAYAWVHGPGGTAPLSGALESNGYHFEERLEGFYGGALADPCPACAETPCVCPADVYWRGVAVSGAGGDAAQGVGR